MKLYKVEQQDENEWSVAEILCDEPDLKGTRGLGSFPTEEEANAEVRRLWLADGQCGECGHDEHAPGYCATIFVYPRGPSDPPGNQGCCCGIVFEINTWSNT